MTRSRGSMLSTPTIAEALARPHNGFTLVRLALAIAVVVSHAFSVSSGDILAEPLVGWTGFTLGEHAVNGFFAVSGFLVTMSFVRRGWRDFAIARLLRVLPGLVTATFVVAIAFGVALTSLPASDYLASAGLWRFIWGTLTSFKTNAMLPRVFADNPFTFPMGTVWTLKYEILCYAGVLVVGCLGLLRRPLVIVLLAAGLGLALLGLELVRPEAAKAVQTALRLPFIFALGGALYVVGPRVRLSAVILVALAVVTALLSGSFAYRACLFAAETYGVIWLAFLPWLSRPALDPADDLSYGTYLYGWPVQQTLTQLFPGTSGPVLLVPSLAISFVIAALSWRGVERPALALKARALGRRTIRATEPATP